MGQMKKRGRRWRRKRRKMNDNQDNLQSHSSEPPFVQLRQWMKTKDFGRCHLEPADFQSTGRGLRATRAIHFGDVIVSIPKKLLITTDTVLDSYLGPLIKSQSPPLTAIQILSVFLILERHRGKSSSWYPYVSVLPGSYTNAAYWEDSDVELVPESLRHNAVSQIKNVNKSFLLLHEFIESVERRWPRMRGALTLTAYRWAWSSVNTRSVYMQHAPCAHVSTAAGDNHYALAPLLDLLNHHSTAEVSASFKSSTQCYEIQTHTPYKKFDQVFINYGPHDNHKLLLEYGFLLPHNPQNVLLFDIDDIKKVTAGIPIHGLRKRFDILVTNDLHRGLTCNEDGLSWKLLTALRVMCLLYTQLNQWKVVLEGDLALGNHEDCVRKMAWSLLSHAATGLNNIKEEPVETTQSAMILTLRKQQLDLVEANLTKLDQELLYPE